MSIMMVGMASDRTEFDLPVLADVMSDAKGDLLGLYLERWDQSQDQPAEAARWLELANRLEDELRTVDVTSLAAVEAATSEFRRRLAEAEGQALSRRKI